MAIPQQRGVEDSSIEHGEAPRSTRRRWVAGVVGPGLVVAAMGIGAGDTVASLAGGGKYGLGLVWAIVLGAVLKFAITEGIGRWWLATGRTPVEGFAGLGRWVPWYLSLHLLLHSFFYGAAITAATGLALTAMFPVLSGPAWAVISGVVTLGLLWIGRYGVFEIIMKLMCVLMFVSVIGAAIATTPSLVDLVSGFRPALPDGSVLYALGLIGGVGATVGLATYAYWLRDKKWTGPGRIPMMRLDVAVAFIATPLFVAAMSVVGAEFLYGTGRTIESSEGMIALLDPFEQQFGVVARWLFQLGFFSAVATSLLGGINALGYLFADCVRVIRSPQGGSGDTSHTGRLGGKSTESVGDTDLLTSTSFRLFVTWCTIPPLALAYVGDPVSLVLLYGTLGAIFLPLLSLALLVMLNSSRVPRHWRNGLVSNAVLGLCVMLFTLLLVQQVIVTV